MPPFALSADEQRALAEIDRLQHADPAVAAALCETLIATSRQMKSPLAHIEAIERFGMIMDHGGRPGAARNVLFEGLQVVQALHLFQHEAHLLEMIARGYYTAGEYRPAIQHWARAVEVAELPGSEAKSWMLAKVGLGQVYDALGDHDTAVTMHRAALTRIHEVNDPYLYAKIKINLGVDLAKSGHAAEARVVLAEALACCEQHHFSDYSYSAEISFRLAELDLEDGDLDQAQTRLDAALAAARAGNYRWGEANIMAVQAELYAKRNNPAQALAVIHDSIGICHDFGLLHILQRQHLAAARYAEQLGEHAKAFEALKAGFELSERIHESSAIERRRHLEEKAGLQISEARVLLELSNFPAIDAGDLARSLAEICQRALEIMRVERVAYRQFDSEQNCLTETTLYTAHGVHHTADAAWPLANYPELSQWLKNGDTLIAHDALHHHISWRLHNGYLAPNGISSILGFPIALAERVYGALLIEQTGAQRNWVPDDILYGNQLAEIAGRAVAGSEHVKFRREINELNHQLMQANDQLEAKVAKRTQELEARNAELNVAMEKLVQSEKLASLGSLVAGVAHELNTPIGTALTAASTLQDEGKRFGVQLDAGNLKRSELGNFIAKVRDGNDIVTRNLERAGDLIHHFKQVAVDTASTRRRVFDLRATLDEVFATLAPMYRRTQHQILIEIAKGIELDSYPGPLGQIMTNLVSNSLIHGFDGVERGTIRISASEAPDNVQLVYEDDGLGIPANLHKRVFDPFFTTRLGQGGSGLGLYLVYNLVTGSLGGELKLESAPAHGARFTLILPKQAA
ncbi:ATP-binding protein [Andreprevotia chitinilytica]|uniref:ATP-binding protein n=1 Tax=Andreprevotia chitinilytica TaxID=396808 RepID=UPI00068EC64C|nr:ATP-binding protein [Andreprevotia chitinilytica]